MAYHDQSLNQNNSLLSSTHAIDVDPFPTFPDFAAFGDFNCGKSFGVCTGCWDDEGDEDFFMTTNDTEPMLQNHKKLGSLDFSQIPCGLDESDVSTDSSVRVNEELDHFHRTQRSALFETQRRVVFSEQNSYCDPAEPLADDEYEQYFWTEMESQLLKLERKVIMTKFRKMIRTSPLPFWNDLEDGSIRGLEDNLVELRGSSGSYSTRRHHEKVVLREYSRLSLRGAFQPDKLRDISVKSSRDSCRKALQRGKHDHLDAQSESGELHSLSATDVFVESCQTILFLGSADNDAEMSEI